MLKIGTQLITALLISNILITACVSEKESAQRQPSATATASQDSQKPSLSIPDAEWEPPFFEFLETHTRGLNLPSLRTVVLPGKDDLEVRFWIDGLARNLNGVVIKRQAGQWSAIRVYETGERQEKAVTQESLAEPSSGWKGAWEKLVSAGILMLPDASKVNCNITAVDGVGFVVETNFNWSYRTYYYRNPQLASCDEAKRMMSIVQVMADEFTLSRKL